MRKIVFICIGLLVVVVACFGGVVFGVDRLANNSYIMNMRKYTYFNLRDRLGLTFRSLPFSVTLVQRIKIGGSEGYIYALSGTFDSIDADNQVLYLQTRSGKSYGFKFYSGSNKDEFAQGQLAYQEVIGNGDIEERLWIFQQGSVEREVLSPFLQTDVILIYWEDNRKMDEIMQAVKVEPNGIINVGKQVLSYQQITRFVYDK